MIENKRVGIIAASALVLALCLPAVGSAALTDGSEDYKVSITYGDLDLNAESGVVSLYSRLKNAAVRVCGSTSLVEAGSVRRSTYNKSCQNDFLNRAVVKFNNQKLSDLHNG